MTVAGEGVAGGGAAEQARRSADRVADLRRQLEAAERRQRAWEAGAEGERLVAAELDALTAAGWSVLHDVRWPGRQRANLDHVLVGPGGVVVVDSKNWTGQVSVRDGVLRVGSHRKDRELEAVSQAVEAVAELLEPAQQPLVRGLVCLVQHDLPPRTTAAQVPVVGREHVAEAVRALPARWRPAEVRRTAAHLEHLLGAPAVPAARRGGAPLRPQRRPSAAAAVLTLLVACLVVGLAAALLVHGLGALLPAAAR